MDIKKHTRPIWLFFLLHNQLRNKNIKTCICGAVAHQMSKANGDKFKVEYILW
jgi:hypothetical protein